MVRHQPHEHGEVSMVRVPYAPTNASIPNRADCAPMLVNLFYEDDPDHPAGYITFGGKEGQNTAVVQAVGNELPITKDYCKKLVDQIDRFLHHSDRRVFSTIQQAASRLLRMWIFLHFSDAVSQSFKDQAIVGLRQVINGDLIGFNADFALHSWNGYFNQNYSFATQFNKMEND